MKRLTLTLLFLLASLAVQAQTTPTTVVGPLYNSVGGTPFSGTIQIYGPGMNSGGITYLESRNPTPITITNGVLSVQLIPNDTAQPLEGQRNAYRVEFRSSSGATWTEYWQVPTSATSVQASQIRTGGVPPPSPMSILPQQINTAGATVTKLCLGVTAVNTPMTWVTCGSGGGGSFATITGQPTDNANLATALSGKAPVSHEHDGAALTSGTVPSARLPIDSTMLDNTGEIGVNGAIFPMYTIGNGAPTGSCQPGRDFYIDQTTPAFYFCPNGTYQIVPAAGGGGETGGTEYNAPLDFGSLHYGGTADLSYTATGAIAGQPIAMGLPDLPAGVMAQAIPKGDQITWRILNMSGAPVDLTSLTWKTSTPGGGGAGTDDQTATEVPFTPAASIAATNVQAAIEELVSDANSAYAAAAHNHSGTYEPVISAGTTSQYWRGDKSWQTLDKTAVGLSNVDNTSNATERAATATLTNKTLTLPVIGSYTVGTIPAAGTANRVALVTDGTSTSDCTTGSGSTRAICVDTGSAWVALGGSGTSITVKDSGGSTIGTMTSIKPGSAISFSLSTNELTIGVNTADLLTLSGTQTFTGKTTTDLSFGTGITTFSKTNAGTTGTTQYRLAKIDSSGNAVDATTSDTDKPLFVVASGAGTSGSAQLVSFGRVQCYFDAAATRGQRVVKSATATNQCEAVTTPADGEWVLGVVDETTGGAGLAYMVAMSPWMFKATQTTITGNAGTATALQTARNIGGVSFDGTAAIVPQTVQTVDSTDSTSYVAIFDAATGDQQAKTDAGLTYNASTGVLTATGFSGPLTGAVTGNASTATTLATARAIYGNNFDGSAALTQIIASTYGGTGNGFTKFSGPTTAEKTFTLPDASATILTTNAAVTVAQGGTGLTTGTSGGVPYFSSTSAMTSSGALTANAVVIGGGAGAAPSTISASTTTTHALFATAGAPAFRALATTDLPDAARLRQFGAEFNSPAANDITYVRVPYACTLVSWSIIVVGGTTPTVTFDLLKIATGTTLPSSSITASAKPALSTGNALKSTTMTGWTTSVTADDMVGVKVDAITGSPTKAQFVAYCQL